MRPMWPAASSRSKRGRRPSARSDRNRESASSAKPRSMSIWACNRRVAGAASLRRAAAAESNSAISNHLRSNAVLTIVLTSFGSALFRSSLSHAITSTAPLHAATLSPEAAADWNPLKPGISAIASPDVKHPREPLAELLTLQILADAVAPGSPVILAEIFDDRLAVFHVVVRKVRV